MLERVADYVIKRLEESNINHIFMVTGRGILYLTDAVAKNEAIEGVSTYHEQGASYAAMAYAAARDGMAACLISTGCAAANAVTTALCAYQDNLPIVFISGQNMLQETTRFTGVPIRTYGSQEADIISIVKPITKYSVMLTDQRDAKRELDKAIYFANHGRKGPVWIDIPLDIQNARIAPENMEGWIPESENDRVKKRDVDLVVELLREAKRPLLFLGGGVRSANATKQVSDFVEKINIPVVFSTAAPDAYGTYHKYSIGAVGSLGGTRAGNFATQNADMLIVLGSKLCSQTTGTPEQFARDAKIVVVDIDDVEHTKKGVNIDIFIKADVREFLDELLQCELDTVKNEWILKCFHWKSLFALKNEKFIKEQLEKNQIDLYYFSDIMSECLPNDVTVITDAGFEELIIPSSIRYKETQRCLFPAAQGAMGYALPAVLGAHFAGKKNIVVVVGDGSFMMNMQELYIIQAHKIPVKIFVINNNMYAVIRKRQRDLFRTRTIGNDPSDGVPAPEFKKIAESVGMKYFSIDGAERLTNEVHKILSLSTSCVCEVACVEEQPYFHMSFAFNEKRKLEKRPLEDLSPFLDRELIYSEMVVKPMIGGE